MQIRRLILSNFRGVKSGQIKFDGHTILIGGNSVGKSTVCEALDLLLGPDRLSRSNAINEHDFYRRTYLDEGGEPVKITLEVVLTDLSPELDKKYRAHREYWDTEKQTLLDEEDEPEDTEHDHVIPALRIAFEGQYDKEEDEFTAQTYFASPPSEEGESRVRVSPPSKREFGFIYLRALRTGARALSLERGSLLDIILRLKDEDRSAMWEQTLGQLESLDPPIDQIPQLKDILQDIDKRARRFISLTADGQAFRLFPSSLTREDLRKSITLFGTSERSSTPVPYWRLGSGVVNALVFSLLTFIAQLKKNVIFAMEEPEIAIPPHTQRRIVKFLRDRMQQAILTTHSPFVLEQFNPEEVVILGRDQNAKLEGREVEIAGIKAKTYRGNLRRILAEAMLGTGVVCVEGVSDAEVLTAASNVLEDDGTDSYTPLDLSGVTILQCEGDSSLLRYGKFFRDLGKKTYAFYDKQANSEIVDEIGELFDEAWQLQQTGIEYLLADEVTIAVLRKFLKQASKWDDYPSNSTRPELYEYESDLNDAAVRDLVKRVLRARKGSGYAGRLVELCKSDDLPTVIVEALEKISEALPDSLAPPNDVEEDDNDVFS
ncbi:MAG: AAA family ATPase [Pseudorhodoplanes sp.]|nr:AAA family ATPase [Pseudorhodoplanes sp.]